MRKIETQSLTIAELLLRSLGKRYSHVYHCPSNSVYLYIYKVNAVTEIHLSAMYFTQKKITKIKKMI